MDAEDKLTTFSWHMPFCPHPKDVSSQLKEFLKGREAGAILDISLKEILTGHNVPTEDEETCFLFHNEMSILKSILARYLAVEREDINTERSDLVSIRMEDNHVHIHAMVWPPKVE